MHYHIKTETTTLLNLRYLHCRLRIAELKNGSIQIVEKILTSFF